MEKKTTFWAFFILALAVGGLVGAQFFKGSGSDSSPLTGEATGGEASSSIGGSCVFVDGNSNLSGTPLKQVCNKIGNRFSSKYRPVAYQRTNRISYFSESDCGQSSFMFNSQPLSRLETPLSTNGNLLFDSPTITACSAGGGNGANEYYRIDYQNLDGVLCCR